MTRLTYFSALSHFFAQVQWCNLFYLLFCAESSILDLFALLFWIGLLSLCTVPACVNFWGDERARLGEPAQEVLSAGPGCPRFSPENKIPVSLPCEQSL